MSEFRDTSVSSAITPHAFEVLGKHKIIGNIEPCVQLRPFDRCVSLFILLISKISEDVSMLCLAAMTRVLKS